MHGAEGEVRAKGTALCFLVSAYVQHVTDARLEAVHNVPSVRLPEHVSHATGTRQCGCNHKPSSAVNEPTCLRLHTRAPKHPRSLPNRRLASRTDAIYLIWTFIDDVDVRS